MLTTAEIPLVQEFLVKQVSCGDTLLEDNLRIMFPKYLKLSCIKSCGIQSKKKTYLDIQLSMVSYAQRFVAHKVDQTKREANNAGNDLVTTFSDREAASLRQAQSNRCSWARATSSQSFRSDRTSRDQADSESNASTHGEFFDTMSDRSTRGSCGWTREISSTRGKTAGLGVGESASKSTRRSKSGGGTAPMAGGGDLSAPFFVPTIGVFPPSFTLPDPVSLPGLSTPQCGGVDDEGNVIPCVPLPNYGRSYQGRSSATLALVFPTALVGGQSAVAVELKFEIGYGKAFRQTSTCSFGRTCVAGGSESNSKFAQDSESKSEGTSLIEDYSSDNHDIHRYGETHRTSESKTDALAVGTMRSSSERHTASDNSAHGQSQGSGEASGWSKYKSGSKSDGSNTSRSKSVEMYWDAISSALNDIWNRIFAELKQLEDDIINSVEPYVLELTNDNEFEKFDPCGYAIYKRLTSHCYKPLNTLCINNATISMV